MKLLYICKKCDYSTDLKCNFLRHKKSKRHRNISRNKKNIKQEDVNFLLPTAKPNTDMPQILFCKYCASPFSHRSSLSRHIKYSCNKMMQNQLKNLQD